MKIVLGTVQLGLKYGINNSIGKPTREDACSILKFAWENGVRKLDTADTYGDVLELIAFYQQNNPDFYIMSKMFKVASDKVEKEFSKSLARLKANSMHTYYFHRFDELLSFKDFKVFEEFKNDGKLKYLGVSVNSMEEFQKSIKFDEIDVIQIPFNLLDNYTIKKDLLCEAKKKGKLIYIRSVFLQGLFFMELDKLPDNLLPLEEDLRYLQSLSEKYNCPMHEMALRYCLSFKEIDGVIIGVDSLEHLKQNLSNTEVLDEEILESINNINVECKGLLSPVNWSL